jgi:hypothetical protein
MTFRLQLRILVRRKGLFVDFDPRRALEYLRIVFLGRPDDSRWAFEDGSRFLCSFGGVFE